MQEITTKFIESSIAAFRAIRTFVFQKGAYPRNFDIDFWKEEDYQDPDLRRSIREEFELYLQMLVNVYFKYVKALDEATSYIESEYNNLVINSRNLEQSLKLFKGKYEEAMFVIEWQLDINKTLGNYLIPLQNHNIISSQDSRDYQKIICCIGLYYCEAVNVVCEVFDIEKPWNKNRPETIKIENSKTESTESGATVVEDGHTSQITEKNGRSETKSIKRQIPSEFAEYFNAPFKGIGGNINFYEKLVSSLTDVTRERSSYEYGKIALLIYKSNKMLQRKRPNTFREWYNYFCSIVGCEYNSSYKPTNLSANDALKKEFYYLLE